MRQPRAVAALTFAFVVLASLLDMLSTYAACGVPGLVETNPFFDDACLVFARKILGLTLLLWSVFGALLFWVSRSARLLCPPQHLVTLRAFWRWLLWGGGVLRRRRDLPSLRAALRFLLLGRNTPDVPYTLILRSAILWGSMSFACARAFAALSNAWVLHTGGPSLVFHLGRAPAAALARFGAGGDALTTFAWGQVLLILLCLFVGQWLTRNLLRWSLRFA